LAQDPMTCSVPAHSDLAARLREANDQVRCWILSEIGGFGESHALALGVGGVVEYWIKNGSNKVSIAAVKSLGHLGTEGARHWSCLVNVLEQGDAELQAAALGALASLEMVGWTRDVLPLMTHEDERVRANAVLAMGVSKDPEAPSHVRNCLQDPEAVVVSAAALALARFSDASSSASTISALLSSEISETRRAALTFFATVGSAAKHHMVDITRSLADSDVSVRCAAVGVFESLGDDAEPFLADVVALLRSEVVATRCAAASALAAVGEVAGSHSRAVVGLLSDQETDEDSSHWVACLVAKPPAAMRVPKCAAAAALAALGSLGQEYADGVAMLLQDANSEVRRCAAEALGKMGMAAARFQHDLLHLCRDESVSVASAAIFAFGRISAVVGDTTRSSLDLIAKQLKSKHATLREAGVQAFGLLGEASLVHVDDLVGGLKDPCTRVRLAVIGAILCLGPRGQLLASEVARMLQDKDSGVRIAALRALSQFGKHGAGFTEEMVDLLDDADEEVRAVAVSALDSFGVHTSSTLELSDDESAAH